LLAAGAIVAAAATISCGAGIHTAEGWTFVEKEMDSSADSISLREATLEMKAGCLDQPTEITLRRHIHYKHSGAVGPIFEIQLPNDHALKNTAQLDITAPSEVIHAPDPVYTIGYIEAADYGPQWVPDMTEPRLSCPEGTVCGRVQVSNFANPGGIGGATRIVSFAIVQLCTRIENCPDKQNCSSGACQECSADTPCNE
jgi:hypothetical protein